MTRALLAGEPEAPPPGSLLFSLEGASYGVEIDAGGLRDETVERLRTLGYLE